MCIPYVYFYGNKLIYCTLIKGVDYTTDRHFYDYILARKTTPERVVILNTTRELKQTLRAKGVFV